MKCGFSFNGIHSNSISGLTVKTVSRPITSAIRDSKITVPCADGAYSTATANPRRRAFYDTRVFTVSMQLTAPNLAGLNKKLAIISEWLTGPGSLIFDDAQLIAWEAIGVGAIDFAPERYGQKAVLTASFEVQPYGHLIWSVGDGPLLGVDVVTLDAGIPIGADECYSTVMTGSKTVMSVINYGSRYVRPLVTIKLNSSNTERSVGTVTVTANGDTKMSLYTSGGEMRADCDNHMLTDGAGNSIMSGGSNHAGFSGEFIELRPGMNTLTFEKGTPSTSGKIDISVDFVPAVMWDINLNEME